MIGDDILQIGTSKWTQQREDITANIENIDNCFMLPSVANVSAKRFILTSMFLFFAYLMFSNSLFCCFYSNIYIY